MKAFAISLFPLLLPLAGLAQEAEDIRDIKDLVEIPAPPNYTLWIIAAVVVLIIALLLWKLLTRKKQKPGTAASVIALRELNAAEKLIPGESPEPLVLSATDTIRRYIEKRFSISATRQTTEEFLREIHHEASGALAPFRDELGTFLISCDGVKFGRAGMEASTRQELLESARSFVHATQKPQPAATEK
ncbi:MAG: hypothetical protein P1V20_08100 [Verrucomicrobiales bacterium]|nr:hypothetical protein [Verrucomicrobiales bacterium]